MKFKRKRLIKRVASQSVINLIDESHDAYLTGKIERAARYIRMAWELLKKNKTRLPKEYRNAFCRKCLTPWIPGETATVKFDRMHNCLRIKCRKCGFEKRL
ncbi:MAG: hypothetical protein QXT05_02235 [Candidatus Bilamarchaeaceae archaeon]